MYEEFLKEDERLNPVNQDKNDYAEFNKFQNYFYSDINMFASYSDYEIINNSYRLINVIAKRYPILANDILSINNDIIKFDQCPDLIRALQHNFVNPYVRNNKEHLYYKQATKKAKSSKIKAKILSRKNKPKDVIDFPSDTVTEIINFFMIDFKTYERVKYTDKVQNYGKEIERKFLKSYVNKHK